jgi:hypothetical protein
VCNLVSYIKRESTFRPKWDEVTGDWRKMYNGELHNLFWSPNIIRHTKLRRMRWAWHVARTTVEGKVHKVMVGKPEGENSLGRARRRWEEGVKMDLRDPGCGGGGGCVEWIHLAPDRDRWRAVVNTAMNLRFLAPRSQCQ